MRKIVFILLLFSSAVVLTNCNNKNKEQIVGIWQLQSMDINGTKLDGASLGRWLWEFNEQGGYLADIDGMREKGTYKLNNKKLTLHVVNEGKSRPELVYDVATFDSVNLDLTANTKDNKTALHFIKLKENPQGEKD